MQPVNAILPGGLAGAGFVTDELLAPRQALVAFFSRVRPASPSIERVPLDEAFGRVLAEQIDADDEYPNAARSAMDGFALAAAAAPGDFAIIGEVRMGEAADAAVAGAQAVRIPTGGLLPPGADAVVPIEDVRISGSTLHVAGRVGPGENVIPRGADMHRGEPVLTPGRRIAAPQAGVLATLGITDVPVYRRPIVGVLSSGDELVAPTARPKAGEVRDSNRYAVAASLRAMGAQPRHYARVADESADFARALSVALRECDAVAMTGGSSVGERDRLPAAVDALGKPGVVVHGLRVKPGKPALLGAVGGKPILGLPGNPTSALLVLEAVAAPIVAALVGAPALVATTAARLAQPARSRAGWTCFVPVALRNDGGTPLAHPLPLRSFSVSLTARADGYLVMDEREEEWPAGATVTVHRFLGG
ncbi:MAG: molybdopterin molybdotransferase MoeA [Candidatus Tumulicola sp.]